jgi:hypothetical protein
VTTIDLPAISLLDVETSKRMSEDEFSVMLREVVAIPVAELMDRSRPVIDLVSLLTAKPRLAMLPGPWSRPASGGLARGVATDPPRRPRRTSC